MKIITKIKKNNKKNISLVSDKLKNGEVVALPTETVYGLAGRYDSNSVIKKIFKVKSRPFHNPLILHYTNSDQALDDIYYDSRAIILAKNFWPGPLTIVAKSNNKSISKYAVAGLETVAVRVPSNLTMLAVLKNISFPLAAPSANRYGKISPTSAKDVLEELNGKISIILDGGESKVGLESTVVDLSGKNTVILRHGGISKDQIKEVLEISERNKLNKKIISPGLSKSHYKPDKPLRINALKPKKNEAWLAFGKTPKNFEGFSLTLSESKCLYESAKNLYKMLRYLDKKKVNAIAVQTIPNKGIGKAINDRLLRASNL